MILLDTVLDKKITYETFEPGIIIFGIFALIGLFLWITNSITIYKKARWWGNRFFSKSSSACFSLFFITLCKLLKHFQNLLSKSSQRGFTISLTIKRVSASWHGFIFCLIPADSPLLIQLLSIGLSALIPP